ncbi:MAG: hypothetical protein F6K08_28065 [Okeania sp. SIO1H6]|nr:hypothetical protein [Okeania sp. SIO1H6]
MADNTQKANVTTGRQVLEGYGDKYGEEYEKVRRACKQLSQLTAWMWLKDDNFPGSLDKTEIKRLKKLFDAVLKYQAFYNDQWGHMAITCMLINNNNQAVDALENIQVEGIEANKPLERVHKIVGEESHHIIKKIPQLTLKKVYEELVQYDDYNEYVFDEDFTKNYYAKVAIDTYEGSIFYDFFGKHNPENQPKYIVVIPYPPKPQLGQFTVTKKELRAWATQPTTADENSYIPPHFNPYIAIHASSC